MEKLQAKLQAASTEYQKLQSDLSAAVDSRQRLDAQLQENEMVKKVGGYPPARSWENPLKPLRLPLGIRSIDSGKRSLQTYRPCSGKTGPTGSKNKRGSTAGFDPRRYVSDHMFDCPYKVNWQLLENEWKTRSRRSEGNSTRRKQRYVLIDLGCPRNLISLPSG